MAKSKSKVKKKLEIDTKIDKIIFATAPGKVACVAGLIAIVGWIVYIIFDILIAHDVVFDGVWEEIRTIADEVSWPCGAIAASIYLTAYYFITNKRKK